MHSYRRRRRAKDRPRSWPIVAIIAVALLSYGLARHSDLPAQVLHKSSDPLSISVLKEPRVIKMYDTKAGLVRTLDAEEYIYGVVAAEMPARFEPEALKAQAIAARTWLARKVAAGGCGAHEGADICSDSGHCQAWQSEKELHTKWGASYEAYSQKIRACVKATSGQILQYKGQIAVTFYHAVSGGHTEDAQAVFGTAYPYLVSVVSPNEQEAPSYRRDTTLSFYKLYEKVRSAYPEVALSQNKLSSQLVILDRDASGRVSRLKVGSRTISGVDARHLFDLSSANFSLSFPSGSVTFACIGYGHGVGMSQWGAQEMAKNGNGYRDILLHYYTGVSISAWN